MLQNSMLGDLKDKNTLEKLLKGRLPSPDIKQVLIPVHVSNCHWALARIHLPTKSFRFDDSLKWLPPGDLIARLRHLIELLSELLPDNVHLTSRSWKRGTLQLQSVSWILAEFYFNRGLQRLHTGTCIILQKTINGFLCLLIVFLKSETYQLILKDVIKLNRNLR